MRKLFTILLISAFIFTGVLWSNAKRHGVIQVTAGDTVAGGGTEYDTTDISSYLQVKSGTYTSEVDGATLIKGANVLFGSYLESTCAADTVDCSLYVYIQMDSSKYEMLLKKWVIRDDSVSAYNIDTLTTAAQAIFQFARTFKVITVNNIAGDTTASGFIDLIYSE